MNNAFDEGVGRCREIDPPPKCHDFWARRLHRKRKKKTEILFESLGVVAYRRLAYSIRGLTGIRALECDP